MPEEEFRISEDGLEKLLREIARVYKYDFLGYSRESLKRRVTRFLGMEKIRSVSELQFRLLNEPAFFAYFVEELTVNVTEMFRNPSFFKALTEEVFPVLKNLEFIRIWHAGCSTGEEVYSLAILLEEHNLLERSILYGTDLNPHVLEKAKAGVFNLGTMKAYSENYILCGGQTSLSDYYKVQHNQALFSDKLKNRMVFSVHNLVTDQSFNEFHLILCRNVIIYFTRELQERVFGLFTESLSNPGFLGLGAKETLQHSNHKNCYSLLNREEKIWQKKNL